MTVSKTPKTDFPVTVGPIYSRETTAHRILVRIAYAQKPHSLHWTHMVTSVEARDLSFNLSLHLHPFVVCASSEGFGESAHLRMLAWAFVSWKISCAGVYHHPWISDIFFYKRGAFLCLSCNWICTNVFYFSVTLYSLGANLSLFDGTEPTFNGFGAKWISSFHLKKFIDKSQENNPKVTYVTYKSLINIMHVRSLVCVHSLNYHDTFEIWKKKY